MIQKKILKNNTVLIYEQIPYVRSVSIGFWFKVGSINEDNHTRGIAHLIEHMIFKGTKTRSAKDIATELDNIGGHLNAFTAKELTCFYARVLEENLSTACDVLSDMILNSTFEEAMIEREKKVVLEEIAMYNDSPEDFVHEKLEESMWKNHPLSYPISGYKETIKNIKREEIISFMKKYYTADNMVISVAGKFNEKLLIDGLENKFASFNGKTVKGIITKPDFHPSSVCNEKDIEQTYISMAYDAYGYEDDRRFALLAASNILGGGMSSKLFQHVREERGLVYSIGSTIEAYKGCGVVEIYAGMNKSNLEQVCQCITCEIDKLKKSGVTEKELNKAKQQLKSGLIMPLESTTSRMNSNARSMILRNQMFDQDALKRKIDALSIEDINDVVNEVFDHGQKAQSIVTSK